jgi:hypothetical protein
MRPIASLATERWAGVYLGQHHFGGGGGENDSHRGNASGTITAQKWTVKIRKWRKFGLKNLF